MAGDLDYVGTHIAEFDSTCPECGKRIKTGDRYKVVPSPTDFGEKWYVHAECPKEPARGEICPGCFMEKPLTGECENC